MGRSAIDRNSSNRIITTQTVAYTQTSAQVTNVFGTESYQVRLVADSACCVVIGNGTLTATTTGTFLPAEWPEYFTITPGQSIAVIRASTEGLVTATNGTLWVTEVGA